MRTDRPDATLFWKAPLIVSTPADVVLEIEPPHYLAYVPPHVWTAGANGVDVDPWLTRRLHISPCEDGAEQAYLGGLLLDPAHSCVTIWIESVLDGDAQRSEVRLRTTDQGC